MPNTAVGEVIEILESDGEDLGFEDVVFVKSICPMAVSTSTIISANHGASRRRKRTEVETIDVAFSKYSRRTRVASDEDARHDNRIHVQIDRCRETTHKNRTNTSVVIDNDGFDNALISPGFLAYRDHWITSGDTCAIVQHVRQSDKWSCGYRNLQMLLSAILPNLPNHHAIHQKYPNRQNQITVPSLQQIQRALESAWSDGLDPEGAAHYRHKLSGKKSWIGAVEVSTALSYWGIDSTVVQFIRCRESCKLLPIFVTEYFRKQQGRSVCPFCSQIEASLDSHGAIEASTVSHARQLLSYMSNTKLISQPASHCNCPLLPLYLQWDGHSVTIVGMDGPDAFLIFDPLKQQKPAKLPISKVVHKDTQIVMVDSFRSLTVAEYQERQHGKTSTFVATAALEAVSKSIRGRCCNL